MIKGEKRTFNPKVGSICSIKSAPPVKVQIIGYLSDTRVVCRALKEGMFTESTEAGNSVISAYIEYKQIRDEKQVLLDDSQKIKDTIRASKIPYFVVTTTELTYEYSGKVAVIKFKMPKI